MRIASRSLLVVALAALVGCGLGPEFDVTYKVPFTANGTTDCNTAESVTVNLEENEEFAKYKEEIGEARLQAVRVVVTNANLDGTSQTTRASGTLVVALEGGESFTLGAFDVPIVDGQVQEIAFDAAAAEKLMAQATSAPYRFQVQVNGQGDLYPCKFAVRLELDIKVRASAGALLSAL